MDPLVFFEVICPLLQKALVAFICISTVRGQDNFYTKVLKKKDRYGESYWETLEIKNRQACNACIEAGEKEDCPHLTERLPHWQDVERVKKTQALMSDHKALMEQELFGNSCSDACAIFPAPMIDFMLTRPRSMIHPSPGTKIYITVDPNAGGSSRYAIFSAFYSGKDEMHIVGMDYMHSEFTPEQLDETLVAHVSQLHARHELRDCRFVYCPESMSGHEAGRTARTLKSAARQKTGEIEYPDFGGHHGVGFFTTNKLKEEWAVATNYALWQHKIFIHETLTTIQFEGKETEMIIELADQLRRYGYTVSKTGKQIYSGKGVGHSWEDDLCVCLQMNLVCRMKYK